MGIRQKHNFPIYIDQSAQDAGFLIVSAGEIGRSIRINSQELADFVNAEFADIKGVIMKLYFVRHGKTEWNLEGRLQGAKGDSPLLKESIEQVRELGHYLSDTHFDLVFSSDLPRAKKLQSSSWSLKSLKLKVTYTKTLREWQLGKLEGQKISLIKPSIQKKWMPSVTI